MKKYVMMIIVSLLLSACGSVNAPPNDSVQRHSPNADAEATQAPSSKSITFPKVSEPYLPEQAIQNGDVVNVHGKLSNMEKWHQFIEDVAAKKESSIRITQYTKEGDPIFYELVYDGDKIHYTYDNAMDDFGLDSGRPSASCGGVGTRMTKDDRELYILTECDSEIGDFFWFEKE